MSEADLACPEGLEPPTYGLEDCFRPFLRGAPQLNQSLFTFINQSLALQSTLTGTDQFLPSFSSLVTPVLPQTTHG